MKSNKAKSAMTALVVAAMVCTVAMPVKAAESQWINDNGTWSYIKEDGSKAKGWIKDDGCWYAFDDNGSMRTGWVASHEHWYFMGESGVMQSNAWVEENGARYFIKGTGVMAKDYVKDGYELTSDGKAIPLAETNSVVVTDPSAVEGQVIEGNLYVDVTTAKELELKGVTVKGKLVIIGDNQTAGKVTVTDSKIEAISTQTRNAEVVLSGETAVKEIVIEETSAVTPDKNFKGEVEKIEVQSTTKGEIKIEVPAQEVSTRTYASVDIQAPVEHLEVKTDTQVKVNADVKNVVVTESAKDTKVEVSKGNTVGTIVADAPVKIEGSGTVNKVEANVDGVEAGEDTVIKEVEKNENVTTAPEVSKPEKPSTGGGSTGGSGGGSYVPPVVDKGVKNEAELKEALSELKNGGEILIGKDFEATDTITITNAEIPSGVWSFTINGQGNTIDLKMKENENTPVLHFDKITITTGGITLKNIKLTGGTAGILIDGTRVNLDGTVDLSGNTIGGIQVIGKDDWEPTKITIEKNARLLQDEKAKDGKPFIWTDDKEVLVEINDKSKTLTAKTITKDGKDQTHYFFRTFYEVSSLDELKNNLASLTVDGEIFLTKNIEITEPLIFGENSEFIQKNLKSFRIDGQGNKIIYKGNTQENATSYVLSVVGLGDTEVILSDIGLTGADTSLLVKDSKVKLDANIDVSGNTKAGIEVAKGENVTLLDVSKESIVNNSEYREVGGLGNRPTITVDGKPDGKKVIVKFKQFSYTFKEKIIDNEYQYYQDKVSLNVTSATELASIFNDYMEGDKVNLTNDITLDSDITLKDSITFENSADRTINLNGNTITIKEGKGYLKTTGANSLEIAGAGKVTGSLYTDNNAKLKINVNDEKFEVDAKSENGWAIYGGMGSTIEIDGGTYSSKAIIIDDDDIKGYVGVIHVVGKGSSLSVKNAIVNVEANSVMGAYGIHSYADTNVLDHVTVNGSYSMCVDFNNENSKNIITNSEFNTTNIVDVNDKKFSSPTIRYQGTLDISDSKITRVTYGILYVCLDYEHNYLQGLTKNNVVFNPETIEGFADIDFVPANPPANKNLDSIEN